MNPLLLHRVCSFYRPAMSLSALDPFPDSSGHDVDNALKMFDRDTDETYMGGQWMCMELNKFVSTVRPSKDQVDFISNMTRALTGQRRNSMTFDTDHFDQRFFEYDAFTGIMRPLNGFVVRYMSRLLVVAKSDALLLSSLNTAWLRHGLQSDNLSIRGFAFEYYVLTHLRELVSFPAESDPYKIKMFDGNYPEENALNKTGSVLFWPKKWNLRHVHAVMRMVYKANVVQVQAQESAPAPKKPRIARSYVHIIAFQATLSDPYTQRGSLDFYKGTNADCARYVHPDDHPLHTVRHQFCWAVPARPTQGGQQPSVFARSPLRLRAPQHLAQDAAAEEEGDVAEEQKGQNTDTEEAGVSQPANEILPGVPGYQLVVRVVY
jgi:hypothetical protein